MLQRIEKAKSSKRLRNSQAELRDQIENNQRIGPINREVERWGEKESIVQ